MCSWATLKILISNWPRTRKFNQLLHAGKAIAFDFSHCYALITLYVQYLFWLVKIWQVSSCRKYMQRLETCLLIAEADRVLCHLVMFETVFFYLMYKRQCSCYQDCSVIHGWFVYCAFCWQMHRLPKSLEIRFRMTSFSKMSLPTCPCLRGKRVEKSQAILEHLMTFGSDISTGKPEQLLSLMCIFFVFGFLKWSVWFIGLKFLHEQWSKLQ